MWKKEEEEEGEDQEEEEEKGQQTSTNKPTRYSHYFPLHLSSLSLPCISIGRLLPFHLAAH